MSFYAEDPERNYNLSPVNYSVVSADEDFEVELESVATTERNCEIVEKNPLNEPNEEREEKKDYPTEKQIEKVSNEPEYYGQRGNDGKSKYDESQNDDSQPQNDDSQPQNDDQPQNDEQQENSEKPVEKPKAFDPFEGHEKEMPNYKFTYLTYFDKWFEISQRGSTYARELIGGLTTFISMVYILSVNPNILSTANGGQWDSIFIATCFASFISTCVMALLPNVPFALSCGLGLNAQVMLYTMGYIGAKYTYGGAMCIVFISGVIFLAITLVGFREYIFDSIPKCIKSAIPVGIGLFIAHIGMQNANIVVGGATLVGFVSINGMYLDPVTRDLAFQAIVCFLGLFAICILDHYNIKGCVFIGIVFAALIGIAFGVTPVEAITKNWNVGKRFTNFFSFDEHKGGTFGLCFPGFKDAFSPGTKVPTTIVLIISYGMVDLFDTLGTVYGLGLQSNLLDKETGKCRNFTKVLFADCIGAVFGSIFGTSSVTTYVESSTGIAVGGRTGLTALTCAVLFLISIFLSPIFNMIPGCATAPALIYVGVQMMSTVLYIDFSKIIDAIPIFVTIVFMPLSYSITNGMCLGVITYTVVHILRYLGEYIYYAIRGKMPVLDDEGAAANPNDAAANPDDTAESDESSKEAKTDRPQWPINIGLGIITLLFALTVFLPTQWKKSDPAPPPVDEVLEVVKAVKNLL